MELTTKYKISYSLLLLSLGAIIYVRLNLDTHKLTMAKLLKLKAYPISNDPKKLSNTLLSKDFNNVNSIPGTTGPGIPNSIRSTLSTKYGPVDESATSFYGAGSAVDRFEKECGWNSTLSTLNHPECLDQFNFKRQSSSFDISSYYNDVDIVIPTIRDLDFLESWRKFFQHFHLIIIQDGDPNKFLQIPLWADYELYNRNDIDRILGKEYSWIISSQDASIRNFGFLVSKKTFIYTIDDDCLPAENIDGQQINALLKHIQNLVTNSTPYFFNTLYDPYENGSDFVRGYPFSLRQGVKTAISHGIWLNAPDYDAPTQLFKIDERNKRLADITLTIPYGILYPMCSMNVAFNRKLIGAAFMQGLMGLGQPWARYDDMFAGWASKVIADHLKLGVKSGSPYIRHNKASNPFINLKKEYMGLFWQEELISFFQQIQFSSSAQTPEQCYLELAQMIRKNFKHLNKYFDRLAKAMEIWIYLWKQSQNDLLKFQLSRPVQKGLYAVLTVCRNEAGYLPIWLKYYRRFFSDNDIYILDNDSNDGSTLNLTVNIDRVHSVKYFDHMWLVNIVQNKTQDLLNSGYKYVLFTEIDEIVMPDPLKYPFGLIEYINKTNQTIIRVQGYDIRHDVKTEAKLNLSEPILQQRRFWFRHRAYDKPLLTRIMPHWIAGFHACKEAAYQDGDLKMFHLQRMDHDFYMQRAEWKSKQNFKIEDIQKGWGYQHRYSGEKAERFFADIEGELSEIPKQYRSKPLF